MQIERIGRVEKLSLHPSGAAKGTGSVHAIDQVEGEHFVRLVMLRKRTEDSGIVEEFLQHLRRRLDKVGLGRKPGDAAPRLLSAQDVVHQVSELVEEGDDIGILQQARIAQLPSAKVADQRPLGQLAAPDAGHDWT